MPEMLAARSAAAVVFTWESAAPDSRRRVAAICRRVAALRAASIDVAIIGHAAAPAVSGSLWSQPHAAGRLLLNAGPGAGLFEAAPGGLRLVPRQSRGGGRREAMRGILAVLAGRGIGPGLVLLVGSQFGADGADSLLLVPEAAWMMAVSVGAEPGGVPAGVVHAGGGPRALLRLLDEQVRRRRYRRVPAVDEDPAWILGETAASPLRRRVTESLFTLGAAGLATRGAVEEEAPGAQPMVLAAGVYDGAGPGQHLLAGPIWTGLTVQPGPAGGSRVLDLRTGVLERTELTAEGRPLRTFRLASITVPGVVALRAEGPPTGLPRPGRPLRRPPGIAMATGRREGVHWARADAEGGGGIGVVARQRTSHDGEVRTVQRLAAYACGQRRSPDLRQAADALRTAEALGFDRLLAEHRAAWAQRWETVDVQIGGDPEAELALRFALFQLWCLGKARGELAVGARGLSGTGYAGHVFWDADVFTLPALVTMDPAAAAAMVRYRRRRLAAARARARAAGLRGARFPWESAASGEDVTPASAKLDGRLVPILTGQLEEHVTAGVAWGAVHYARWADRPARLVTPLLLETARYWASRCRLDDDGRAHIDGVIGPDEYHERVNDNAYTNVMARWNLRAAADAADRAGSAGGESSQWRELAGWSTAMTP